MQVYFCFVFELLNVKQLLFSCFHQLSIDQEADILAIYWNTELKCQKAFKIIISYIFCNESAFLGSLLHSFYCIYCGDYDTSKWTLPFEVNFPLDSTHLFGWYFLWFIQVNMSMSYVSCATSISSFFVGCCLYICGICDHYGFLFNLAMENVQKNQREKNRPTYVKRQFQIRETLIRMVKVHVKALQ